MACGYFLCCLCDIAMQAAQNIVHNKVCKQNRQERKHKKQVQEQGRAKTLQRRCMHRE